MFHEGCGDKFVCSSLCLFVFMSINYVLIYNNFRALSPLSRVTILHSDRDLVRDSCYNEYKRFSSKTC